MVKTERATISFDAPATDALARLVETLGMTKTDVVNRGIKLYDLVQADLDAGNSLAMVAPDGTVTRITIL